MHRSSKSLTLNRIRENSERGKRMAQVRWKRDREQRAMLAKADPAFTGLKIARRVIVVTGERTVKEAVIYACDSARSANSKLRRVMQV